MKRGEGLARELLDRREMQKIDMKMQDVEFASAPQHPVQHQHMVRDRVPHRRVQPESAWDARHKLRPRLRIARCEERHLMALRHQLLGQIGYDPFGAAIKARRAAFRQRRDLGNSHPASFSMEPREVHAVANAHRGAPFQTRDKANGSGLLPRLRLGPANTLWLLLQA